VTDALYCGIDPGASGGIAILDAAGAVVDASAMPETEGDVAEYLREFADRIDMAHIEAVHSFPGQGVASTFTFGVSYGGLRMALKCFRIPFEAVSPMRWQKLIGVAVTEKKDKKRATKAVAQRLFPNNPWTHKTADAVLLAEHARRIYVGLRVPRRTEIPGVLS